AALAAGRSCVDDGVMEPIPIAAIAGGPGPLPEAASYADVAAAAARLAGHVIRTPILRHPLLDALTGGTILVKPEPLQRTGSFKLRGASNAALLLDAAARRGGVVTHSSGNHGQAVACAARALGMRAIIAM